MKSLSFLAAFLLLVGVSVVAQDGVVSRKMDRYLHTPVPHEPMPATEIRVDPARLKHDSDELLFLAESIPFDVDQASKGMLPKDLKDKLRRIEKLSKQLRNEIP